MDEKWSEEGTATNWATGDYALANAFKGTTFVSGGSNPGLPQLPASTGGSNALWDLGANRINNVTSLKVWFFNSRPNNITQSGNLMKINGTDVSSTAFAQAGVNKWHLVDFGSTFVEFQSIELGYETDNYTYFGGIEVNGRLLVDGPADNSQNWSKNLTCADGFFSGEEADKGFDGKENTQAFMSTAAVGNNSPLVYTGPFENVTSFKIYFRGKLYFNGSDIVAELTNGSDAQTNDWTVAEINAPSTINTFEIYPYDSGSGGGFRTLEVNGKLLVDSGAQWNTSQVWSDNITGKYDERGY